MCYTFARATRSVSLCPPAYYARLAALRGRAMLTQLEQTFQDAVDEDGNPLPHNTHVRHRQPSSSCSPHNSNSSFILHLACDISSAPYVCHAAEFAVHSGKQRLLSCIRVPDIITCHVPEASVCHCVCRQNLRTYMLSWQTRCTMSDKPPRTMLLIGLVKGKRLGYALENVLLCAVYSCLKTKSVTSLMSQPLLLVQVCVHRQ